jgi:hypothetical protein
MSSTYRFRSTLTAVAAPMLIATLLLLSTQSVRAIELDLSKSYVEISFGNTLYNTPNDFFFSDDHYDNPTNLQILVGTHFKRNDNKIISIEGFYNIIGEGESIRTINSTSRRASIDSSVFGAGIRLGQTLGESFVLSTRFGIHFWQVDGASSQTSQSTTIFDEGADESGVNLYVGANVSYIINKQLFISGGGQTFPMDVEGSNIYVTNYYVGAGYYF